MCIGGGKREDRIRDGRMKKARYVRAGVDVVCAWAGVGKLIAILTDGWDGMDGGVKTGRDGEGGE